MDAWNSGSPPKEAVFDAFAEVVKALANGRRLELLELMAQGEHSVETLARMTGAGMTTTSAHLQTLKRAGLVRTRRERTSVLYRLAGDDVAELYTAAKRVALTRYPQLRQVLDAYLEQPHPQGPSIDPAAVTSAMVVIDVRPLQEYEAGHFPGSLSIPKDELEDRYTEIPSGAEVVVYCRGELCRMAREAAAWLRERGIDARAMDEGVIEWRATKGVSLDVA
jgi:rhodanese-related sulfurtransferase/DNA-binding transcriptional ArsR family regulator